MPSRLSTLLLLPLLALPLTSAQRCTKPGYGTDKVCMFGSDPYCDGQKCLYQACAKGFFATQVHEEGVIYDRQTANLCTPCPGEGQTTDVSTGGLTYGIGECYVPCGPEKCYVPSSGGLSFSAAQTGTTQCVNSRKGICESTCVADGSLPIPDAYTIGAVCHKTRLKKRTLPARAAAVSARHIKKKDLVGANANPPEKKDASAAPAPLPAERRTSGSKETEKAKRAKLHHAVLPRIVQPKILEPISYEVEKGPYAHALDYRY